MMLQKRFLFGNSKGQRLLLQNRRIAVHQMGESAKVLLVKQGNRNLGLSRIKIKFTVNKVARVSNLQHP